MSSPNSSVGGRRRSSSSHHHNHAAHSPHSSPGGAAPSLGSHDYHHHQYPTRSGNGGRGILTRSAALMAHQQQHADEDENCAKNGLNSMGIDTCDGNDDDGDEEERMAGVEVRHTDDGDNEDEDDEEEDVNDEDDDIDDEEDEDEDDFDFMAEDSDFNAEDETTTYTYKVTPPINDHNDKIPDANENDASIIVSEDTTHNNCQTNKASGSYWTRGLSPSKNGSPKKRKRNNINYKEHNPHTRHAFKEQDMAKDLAYRWCKSELYKRYPELNKKHKVTIYKFRNDLFNSVSPPYKSYRAFQKACMKLQASSEFTKWKLDLEDEEANRQERLQSLRQGKENESFKKKGRPSNELRDTIQAEINERKDALDKFVKQKTQEVYDNKLTYDEALEEARELGIEISSKRTFQRWCKERPGLAPPDLGRQLYFDKDIEDEIVDLIRFFRSQSLPVLKDQVKKWAQHFADDLGELNPFYHGDGREDDGKVTDGWFNSFKHRRTRGMKGIHM